MLCFVHFSGTCFHCPLHHLYFIHLNQYSGHISPSSSGAKREEQVCIYTCSYNKVKKKKKVVPTVSSHFRILFHTLIRPHSCFHSLTWCDAKHRQKGLKRGTSNAVLFTKTISLSFSLCLFDSLSLTHTLFYVPRSESFK